MKRYSLVSLGLFVVSFGGAANAGGLYDGITRNIDKNAFSIAIDSVSTGGSAGQSDALKSVTNNGIQVYNDGRIKIDAADKVVSTPNN